MDTVPSRSQELRLRLTADAFRLECPGAPGRDIEMSWRQTKFVLHREIGRGADYRVEQAPRRM